MQQLPLRLASSSAEAHPGSCCTDKPRPSEQALLATAKAAFAKGLGCAWDCDASDVDLWEMGDGTTLFYFLSGNQGNHIFAALGCARPLAVDCSRWAMPLQSTHPVDCSRWL